MRRIVRTSLRLRWLVLFLAAGILALGFVQIPETKVDVFPEFAPPQVEIQTIALGNSSNEVEQLITVPDREPAERHRGAGGPAVQVGRPALRRSGSSSRAAPTSCGPVNW